MLPPAPADLRLPLCGRGTATVLVANLYRRTEPHADAGSAGTWRKGQILDVWAVVRTEGAPGEWLLLQAQDSAVTAWSHRGTPSSPYLAVGEIQP